MEPKSEGLYSSEDFPFQKGVGNSHSTFAVSFSGVVEQNRRLLVLGGGFRLDQRP